RFQRTVRMTEYLAVGLREEDKLDEPAISEARQHACERAGEVGPPVGLGNFGDLDIGQTSTGIIACHDQSCWYAENRSLPVDFLIILKTWTFRREICCVDYLKVVTSYTSHIYGNLLSEESTFYRRISKRAPVIF